MVKFALVRILLFGIPLVIAAWLGILFSQSRIYLSSEEEVQAREMKFSREIDVQTLAELSGRFFLQMEEQGELWYVSPVTGKRVYLPDNDSIQRLVSEQARAVPLHAIQLIPEPGEVQIGGQALYAGEFLQEQGNPANVWYSNPVDGYRYYFGEQNRALQTATGLADGILNEHLRKIPLEVFH